MITKKLLLALFVMMLPMVVLAEKDKSVEIDGIGYKLFLEKKEAEVVRNVYVSGSPDEGFTARDAYYGEIIIPSSINYDGVDYTVTSIDPQAFSNNIDITSITIPNSITRIEDRSFDLCENLEKITISNGVVYIGKRAFSDCHSLKSITIPYGVKSIEEYTFYGCNNLVYVELPNSVSRIEAYAFSECFDLKTITMPEKMSFIGEYAFSQCNSLQMIVIPDGIQTIEKGTFCDCGLKSVIFPNSVTSIREDAFLGCCNLSSILLGDNIACIEKRAFMNCGFKTVKIPYGLTAIEEDVFNDCFNLKTVDIPNSVVTIGDRSFSGCRSLETISIPDGVEIINANTFYGCSSLLSVFLPSSIKNVEGFADCENLLDVTCQAMIAPKSNEYAFHLNTFDYGTLHVQSSAIDNYKETTPWKYFQNIDAIEEVVPKKKKCVTPTIIFKEGLLYFSCETEGVEYNYNIIPNGSKSGKGNNIPISTSYTISVYASKDGFENSDIATQTIQIERGDVNCDGIVNVADAVSIVNIILDNKCVQ